MLAHDPHCTAAQSISVMTAAAGYTEHEEFYFTIHLSAQYTEHTEINYTLHIYKGHYNSNLCNTSGWLLNPNYILTANNILMLRCNLHVGVLCTLVQIAPFKLCWN